MPNENDPDLLPEREFQSSSHWNLEAPIPKKQEQLDMPGSEGAKTADRKRPPAVMWIIALFFGLLGFYRMTQRPQFESYRTVDVIQLLASGAGFGVALVGLVMWLVRPRA
jgi:hypothetical protein